MLKEIFRRPIARGTGVLLLVGTMALQGCEEQFALTAAGNDPSDSCNSFRQTIAQAQKSDMNEQARNAAIGAGIGALTGAILTSGGNSRDRAAGIALGALGGGLIGLSGTYYRQQAEKAADADALLRNVNADAGAERRVVTQTGRAAVGLRNCRNGQLAALEKQVRSGAVEPAAARANLRQIRSRVNGDNQVISASFKGIGQRVDAYVDASAAAAQVDRAAIAAARPPSNPPKVSRARASTKNVTGVVQDQNRQVQADQQAREAVDDRLKALEILIG